MNDIDKKTKQTECNIICTCPQNVKILLQTCGKNNPLKKNSNM